MSETSAEITEPPKEEKTTFKQRLKKAGRNTARAALVGLRLAAANPVDDVLMSIAQTNKDEGKMEILVSPPKSPVTFERRNHAAAKPPDPKEKEVKKKYKKIEVLGHHDTERGQRTSSVVFSKKPTSSPLRR